jgi:outer membrane protein OmpA-like peptidoglycan-associated protein
MSRLVQFGRMIAVLAVLVPVAALAQELSVDDIIKQLTPSDEPSLKGVTVEPGTEPAVPVVNMRVQFAYDSAELGTETVISLRNLGIALSSPELSDFRFQIVGHTDAYGGDAYNQSLSQRRADAVRQHLAFYYDIDGARLVSLGVGEGDPFDKADPYADINRRVEIRNISAAP